MKTVITFGTFDHFHAGHESYLQQAHDLGDELIVIVARDKTVKQVKGRAPDFSERARRNAVRSSGFADKVILGNADDKYDVIRKYRPAVIALGYDQFTFTFGLQKLLIDEKIDAEIVRLQPYQPDIFKSSIVRQGSGAHHVISTQ